MAEDKKNIIYKCPCCFNRFIDVVIDKYADGMYRCMKCGFNGTEEDVQKLYKAFRTRYKLTGTRMDLDEQRRR